MYSYKCNECGSENIELVICDQGGDSRYGKTFDESWCLDCGELNSFEKEDLINMYEYMVRTSIMDRILYQSQRQGL